MLSDPVPGGAKSRNAYWVSLLILSDPDLPAASGSFHWHIRSGCAGDGCGAAAWALTRWTKTSHRPSGSARYNDPICAPAIGLPGGAAFGETLGGSARSMMEQD